MDTPNIFKEDTDFNICKSWLCGSTDGQTYSISDHFGPKMRRPDGMDEKEWWNLTEGFFNWQVWEDTIGWKHDYKVDDPEVDIAAQKMVEGLNDLIAKVNENPRFWHIDDFPPVEDGQATFYGNAEAIADKAYALVCNELDKIGVKYDSKTDNLIFFNDDKAKKTYVIEVSLRKCDEYEGE